LLRDHCLPSAKNLMTSILVTGGAGYIGSHACKALRRAGLNPISYENLSRGNAEAVKWGPLEVGELADRARLCEVIGHYSPAAVVHFAAFAYVGESNLNPTLYYQNNLGGTVALLEAMHEYGGSKIVFSSSCAVYGAPNVVPIREETRISGDDPRRSQHSNCRVPEANRE
jgi:UDP-arabinose 4-epimerase